MTLAHLLRRDLPQSLHCCLWTSVETEDCSQGGFGYLLLPSPPTDGLFGILAAAGWPAYLRVVVTGLLRAAHPPASANGGDRKGWAWTSMESGSSFPARC